MYLYAKAEQKESASLSLCTLVFIVHGNGRSILKKSKLLKVKFFGGVPVLVTLIVVLTASVAFAAVFNGTNRNDFIIGTNGPDVIRGLGGDDNLVGRNGNDSIAGAGKKDKIRGGGGNDNLVGGKGNDFIVGGAGNDRIRGGGGRDIISGSAGNDTIHTGHDLAIDRVNCGPGFDTVRAGLLDNVANNCETVRRSLFDGN